MQYRLCLYKGHVGGQPRFVALHLFHANGADEAAEIAFDLYSLCSDVITGYELWYNDRCLIQAFDSPTPGWPNFERWTELRQSQMVEHEEMLHASYRCIRQSRKLMQTISLMR
jgi:hypothetical protein